MHFPNRRLLLTLVPAAFATFYVVSACSGGKEYVDHGFEFNALSDSPGVEILDFRYGEGGEHGTRNPQYLLNEGKSLQRVAVYGHMQRPDSLFVKWRTTNDGRSYEDTVNLQNRLPRDFAGSNVYFIVRGAQLEVYFISTEPRGPSDPSIGPSMFQHRKVTKIYPN
jgi:hypothetical protein